MMLQTYRAALRFLAPPLPAMQAEPNDERLWCVECGAMTTGRMGPLWTAYGGINPLDSHRLERLCGH